MKYIWEESDLYAGRRIISSTNKEEYQLTWTDDYKQPVDGDGKEISLEQRKKMREEHRDPCARYGFVSLLDGMILKHCKTKAELVEMLNAGDYKPATVVEKARLQHTPRAQGVAD